MICNLLILRLFLYFFSPIFQESTLKILEAKVQEQEKLKLKTVESAVESWDSQNVQHNP
jgi:hypothetical protein